MIIKLSILERYGFFSTFSSFLEIFEFSWNSSYSNSTRTRLERREPDIRENSHNPTFFKMICLEI